MDRLNAAGDSTPCCIESSHMSHMSQFVRKNCSQFVVTPVSPVRRQHQYRTQQTNHRSTIHVIQLTDNWSSRTLHLRCQLTDFGKQQRIINSCQRDR